MRAVRLFIKHILRYRSRDFILLVAVSLLDALVVFSIPLIISELTKPGTAPADLLAAAQYVTLLFGGSIVLQWCLRRWAEALGPMFTNYLRIVYFRRLAELPLLSYQRRHSGYYLGLISTVAGSLGSMTVEFIWNNCRIAVYLSMFFLVSARESAGLALYNLAFVALFMLVSVPLARRITGYAKNLNRSGATLTGAFTDFGSNMLSVRKLGVIEFVTQRLDGAAAGNNAAIRDMQRFHANRWALLHTIYGGAFVGTIAYLIYGVDDGSVPPSTLILFIATFQMVRQNIERLSEVFRQLFELDAQAQEIEDELRDVPVSRFHAADREWKTLQARNIRFSYPGSAIEISIPFFELGRGRIVGVRGISGEGKTTLLNLLSGLLTPASGTLTLDSEQGRDVVESFMRARSVLISQEVELFNLSLRENLALGMPVSDDELKALLCKVNLGVWLDTLPDGLDTLVGEKGVRLSSGQKQRINLLRGILLDRDVYLLDEPTSHLDAQTEEHVAELIERRLRGKSVVIVTHKDRLFRMCDQVYTMEGHCLSAVGDGRNR